MALCTNDRKEGGVTPMKQDIKTTETSSGFTVEVLHDNHVVWVEHYATQEEVNWFTGYLRSDEKNGEPTLTVEEARIAFEKGACKVNIFYRHPAGFRFADIVNLGALPRGDKTVYAVFSTLPGNNKTGYAVGFVNKENKLASLTVPTLEEAFDVIRQVEVQ